MLSSLNDSLAQIVGNVRGESGIRRRVREQLILRSYQVLLPQVEHKDLGATIPDRSCPARIENAQLGETRSTDRYEISPSWKLSVKGAALEKVKVKND